jgi:hypothetical protein
MRTRPRLSPMTITAQKPMTLAELLAWEERRELRYDFDGVAPVAMTGGTAKLCGPATATRHAFVIDGSPFRVIRVSTFPTQGYHLKPPPTAGTHVQDRSLQRLHAFPFGAARAHPDAHSRLQR